MGGIAATTLVERIERGTPASRARRVIRVEPELVVRGTTARRP
jgi:hypothetical protein